MQRFHDAQARHQATREEAVALVGTLLGTPYNTQPHAKAATKLFLAAPDGTPLWVSHVAPRTSLKLRHLEVAGQRGGVTSFRGARAGRGRQSGV
ncbi:hypothetical protein ACFVRD_35230 [Streptomyces sp. NPDC057908]|uniref:hypothetical protein n=1 Tax=Streptomyces sp. NPDC057908 TaxID=3346276 RepID=UPI0036EB5BEF